MFSPRNKKNISIFGMKNAPYLLLCIRHPEQCECMYMYMDLFLQGYLPASLDRREPTLERKRQEYFSFIEQYYDTRHQEMHQETFRQVKLSLVS